MSKRETKGLRGLRRLRGDLRKYGAPRSLVAGIATFFFWVTTAHCTVFDKLVDKKMGRSGDIKAPKESHRTTLTSPARVLAGVDIATLKKLSGYTPY